MIFPPWAVMSPIRAAGRFTIRTVIEALRITSGGPTHVAISVARAAGMLPISTVMAQGGRMGPPTCGIGGTPGVTIGQTCMSPTRAAGIPIALIVPDLAVDETPVIANAHVHGRRAGPFRKSGEKAARNIRQQRIRQNIVDIAGAALYFRTALCNFLN